MDSTVDNAEFTSLDLDSSIASTGTPRERQIQATLEVLADRTGGKALINFQRDDALSLTVADTRSYYWLGFSPQRASDDARHDLEIRVKGRPDLRVRTRDSFVDLSARSEMGMVVESSLLFGAPPSVKPLFLKFGAPKRSSRRLRVPLEVGINMDDITVEPVGCLGLP